MTNVAEILETMEYGPAPESTAPVEAWLDLHKRCFDLYINGAWVAPTGGKRIDSINPATGKKLAAIAHAAPEDVDTAVKAARAAQPAWAKLGGAGRARYIYALARLIQKHSRLFAVLETMDNGKPIRETRDIDVPLAARHFYHHAGWAQLCDSEFPDHEPVGGTQAPLMKRSKLRFCRSSQASTAAAVSGAGPYSMVFKMSETVVIRVQPIGWRWAEE